MREKTSRDILVAAKKHVSRRLPRSVILMYHRVGRLASDPWRLAVQPAHFEEHLQVIRASFQPVSLRDLGRAVARRRLPTRSVVVTFDDGYRDNLTDAMPLLERYEIPATFFITTGYVDADRDFWWDELEDLCRRGGLEYRAQWEQLRQLDAEARREALDRLWSSLGLRRHPYSNAMSSVELRRLANGDLVEIGAHTVSHPHLSHLPGDEQIGEIRASRRFLQEALDRPIDFFSYPHGDFSAATVEHIREERFACACTVGDRPVTRSSRILELPRFHVDDQPGDQFERWLVGCLRS